MGGFTMMQPEDLGGYQAPPGPQVPELNPINSQMAEGALFAQKDSVACQAVNDYVTKCNDGLAAYTNQAHHATNLYVSTDQSQAGEFNYLSDSEYAPIAFERAAPGADSERPAGVPAPLRIDVDALKHPG